MANKYSLIDQTWEKTNEGYEHKSMFKMVPSMHIFNPMKKYMITLANGINYEGLFRYYVYKKETIESPLIRVYLEFKIDKGLILVPEDSIKDFIRLS